MPLRLLVIDGGDRGQSFRLPEVGTIRIGNYGGHTDICLHDLYVAKDHAHVEVGADGKVVVIAQASAAGTLVNGAKVQQQEIRLEDIIRIGNSYLKLIEADDAIPDANVPANPAEVAPPNSTTGSGTLPVLPTDRLRELVGHSLAHYTVGPALAPGPVGTVFRAHDNKANLDVALKVLPAEFPGSEEEVHRFVEVMRKFLGLNHPGLAALRGVGKTGPYVWVASELVKGESLAQTIRDPRSNRKGKWRPALRAARHAARTLDFLHRKHLVHGSVTPANVLLPADGGPALKDAGLWDALAGSSLLMGAVRKRTLAELPFFSPEHLDPEVPVDDLSDQYCLGAVLYALLTGRAPCEGGAPAETVELIRKAMPLKPKESCSGLPDSFQAVVLRMLSKRPEDRYSGPGSLMADLDAVAKEFDAVE